MDLPGHLSQLLLVPWYVLSCLVATPDRHRVVIARQAVEVDLPGHLSQLLLAPWYVLSCLVATPDRHRVVIARQAVEVDLPGHLSQLLLAPWYVLSCLVATPDRHRVVIARQAGGRGGPAWPSVTTPTCAVVCAILSCGYSRQTQSSYSPGRR